MVDLVVGLARVTIRHIEGKIHLAQGLLSQGISRPQHGRSRPQAGACVWGRSLAGVLEPLKTIADPLPMRRLTGPLHVGHAVRGFSVMD